MHLIKQNKTKQCPLRREEVLLIKKQDMKDGNNSKMQVGGGWTAEIVFLSIKRVLGENLLSKKFKAQDRSWIESNAL